ncbi:MAG: cell division protein FtsQ/DivIB [Pseudonocardiaceae bacterium]
MNAGPSAGGPSAGEPSAGEPSAGEPGAAGQQRWVRRDAQRPHPAARDRRASWRRRGTGRPPSRVRPAPSGAVAPRGVDPRPPRPRRRARNRRRWLVAAGLAAILSLAGTVGWVLLGSSLVDARSVQVIGTRELSADDVQAVAAVPLGTPMLRLDTERIEASVAALPRVAAVQVSRTLGGTVRIAVTERTPIAVWPAPDGAHLVDASGTDFATVAQSPAGLPELRLARVGPGDGATMAALTVLRSVPDQLRAQVLSVGADSPADVVLRLAQGRVVRWGGVADSTRKAAVLGPLLTQPGEVYDISSPDLPTIS